MTHERALRAAAEMFSARKAVFRKETVNKVVPRVYALGSLWLEGFFVWIPAFFCAINALRLLEIHKVFLRRRAFF